MWCPNSHSVKYGINATDADQVTAATLRARAERHTIIRALRKLAGRFISGDFIAHASYRVTGRRTSSLRVRSGRRRSGA
jgi:hypothetical protein